MRSFISLGYLNMTLHIRNSEWPVSFDGLLLVCDVTNPSITCVSLSQEIWQWITDSVDYLLEKRSICSILQRRTMKILVQSLTAKRYDCFADGLWTIPALPDVLVWEEGADCQTHRPKKSVGERSMGLVYSPPICLKTVPSLRLAITASIRSHIIYWTPMKTRHWLCM